MTRRVRGTVCNVGLQLLRRFVLPTLPAGCRAAVRRPFLLMRGGRCRSSAARAKCRWQNGFHVPSAWASRKRDRDAFRRVVLTPERSPLQGPPTPALEYPGVRSSTPDDDNGGKQERGTSVFSGAMRGFSYPCRPQGISRGLLSITGTRSPIARLPRAWRCNTLETRIVCAGIRRIAPPRGPSGRGLHRRPRARRYRRPGGGGEPRRLRQVR